jgi:hypothetical protein
LQLRTGINVEGDYVAFAEDNQGELYIVTEAGSVQRLVAA